MEPWQWGLIMVLALGVVLVAYGVITDRNANRDRDRALHRPPARAVPGFRPDVAAPTYLTELEAMRDRIVRPALTAEELAQLRVALDEPRTTARVDVGYASADFVTEHDTGWAVAFRPQVLVCADEIADVREILTILQGASMVPRAVVLVAPGYAAEVLATLEVNALRATLAVIAVVADSPIRAEICAETSATPVDRATLRGNALHPDRLGECRTWISDRQASWIIRDP